METAPSALISPIGSYLVWCPHCPRAAASTNSAAAGLHGTCKPHLFRYQLPATRMKLFRAGSLRAHPPRNALTGRLLALVVSLAVLALLWGVLSINQGGEVESPDGGLEVKGKGCSKPGSCGHLLPADRPGDEDSYDDEVDWPSWPQFVELEGDPSVTFVHSAVFFPDYVLLLLNPLQSNLSFFSPLREVSVDGIECIYNGQLVTSSIAAGDGSIQCEHPALERRAALWGKKVTVRIDGKEKDSVAPYARNFWQILVYKMIIFEEEGELLLFAKGVHHLKESELHGLSCLFGSRVKTPVVAFCMENFRCKLPETQLTDEYDLVGQIVTLELEGRTFPSVVRWYPPVHAINDVLQAVQVGKSLLAEQAFPGQLHKHDICVCTMVWNVAKFMKEWVMYHSHLGVTRFFIYDNNSDDNLEEVLESLQEFNVSKHPWPWIKTQEAGFGHCAVTAGPECNWIAFIDHDEFLFPQKVLGLQSDAGTPLQQLLEEYNDQADGHLGQLRIPCLNFGPSGLTTLPKSGQVMNYICRAAAPKRVKSIVRVEAMTSTFCSRVHFFELKPEFSQSRVRKGSAMIYHYKFPVWEDFQYKFVRRVSAAVPDWTENERLDSIDRTPGLGTEAIQPKDWSHRFCDVEDTALRDYVQHTFKSRTSNTFPWE